jgi:hypothetical protein
MSTPKPQREADEFNERFSVGDLIGYSELIGEKLTPYRTRTEASVLSGHTAVVWLEGKAGCVCVSHCVAMEPEPQRDTLTADLFAEGAKP